jgi:hypothetical protein
MVDLLELFAGNCNCQAVVRNLSLPRARWFPNQEEKEQPRHVPSLCSLRTSLRVHQTGIWEVLIFWRSYQTVDSHVRQVWALNRLSQLAASIQWFNFHLFRMVKPTEEWAFNSKKSYPSRGDCANLALIWTRAGVFKRSRLIQDKLWKIWLRSHSEDCPWY